MLAEIVLNIFNENFDTQAMLFRSPGRINLIGEHTDYNDGFVLPAAIDKAVYLAIAPAKGDYGRWISVDFGESIEVSRMQNLKISNDWANYLLGVIQEFRSAGFAIPAFDLVVAADIPIGAGMSSSAALECVMAYALNHFLHAGLDRKSLAFLTKRAENNFIGLQCGIMDMFASLHGKKNHVFRLDCRSLEYEYFPLHLNDYYFILLDTGVKHSLASSEYNTRREECAEGIATLKKFYPGLNSLRDVDHEMLNANKSAFDPLIFQRCAYVVEENNRVQLTCQALRDNDLATTGRMMFASHQGLKNQYQVSCAELDFLVDQVSEDPAVLGARMMGGGFGGCTINLVLKNQAAQLIEKISESYQAFSGIALKHYEVVTGEGTGEIKIQSLVQ